MEETSYRAIAIVAVGAILPDASNAIKFWENIKNGIYSISEIPSDRWNLDLYYDPDPKVPDKSYTKIGGWVREALWEPMRWHLPIPPKVSLNMDNSQKWAIACTVEALNDYGFPQRPLNLERTAVIFGNAMAGELHYQTANRLVFPEYAQKLQTAHSFSSLSTQLQNQILDELHSSVDKSYPEITEDTMPGELSNCIAGRVANLFNLHGPNYVCDAACASAIAAISSAIEGLVENDFDTVITGGIDRNMGASTFIKFCKIGALSATGTRPYADGADGFVMGEGATIFILKRLADAERDGDKIYAVIRGIGGASDGKGKGITAPNPIGQKLAIQRAWQNAGLPISSVSLIEGHGTSTKVGDVVEVQSLTEAFGANGQSGTIALGSVKSNIGHLKAAAGAAGLLKATFALHHKLLPPSLNFAKPNPNIDFVHSPFKVNTELRDWPVPDTGIRRAGISAFGFGGTNFHIVVEEYIPGRLKAGPPVITGYQSSAHSESKADNLSASFDTQVKDLKKGKKPLRGALVVGADNPKTLAERLTTIRSKAQSGTMPDLQIPQESDLRAQERIAIDYKDSEDLIDKIGKTLKAFENNSLGMWKALKAQGIFRGSGAPAKVAFLYTGQGSQYVNMLKQLNETEPIVSDTFKEADQVMTPLLGNPLTKYLFVDGEDAQSIEQAEKDLRQTAITQPAVLSVDIGLTRLLEAYGIKPDMVMGHSLGEYGALVISGILTFPEALEAVSARGHEMTRLSVADNGRMAAIFAPIEEVERILKTVDGYAVIANINSSTQSVIGGATQAITEAIEIFKAAGYNAVPLPVSHAFHTSIVAPASVPLREVLSRLKVKSPNLPIVANLNGEFYPTASDSQTAILDLLSQQVASPVQFIKGLQTLYNAGVRIFVEVGPKKALQGFVDDLFGNNEEVISLATNHPKLGDLVSFNQALCGLYAAGLGFGNPVDTALEQDKIASKTSDQSVKKEPNIPMAAAPSWMATTEQNPQPLKNGNGIPSDKYEEMGRLFAEFMERGLKLYQGNVTGIKNLHPVVISGAGLGLPGTEYIFDNFNLGRLLRGEQFIDVIPTKFRRLILDKHITRLIKSEEGAHFAEIDDIADVIKLAARGGKLDLEHQFGIPADRIPALDRYTQLAIAVGLEALRDAGIPLLMHYKTTTKGTKIPDRWGLPEPLRDETGVIFASAFPGLDSFAENLESYYEDHARHELLARLEQLRSKFSTTNNSLLLSEIDQQISDVKAAIDAHSYNFDRRFIFRILSMGHSQFAELIGARGPNTQVNAACASTTQALSLAEDWIKVGRCRRVIIVAADDVTSEHLLEWIGSGFLASGAAATDDDVTKAALPFDRRRHGMIMGMGAAGIVVESVDAVRERGLRPICEVLSTVAANSAFHGTRLDVNHICQVMEQLVANAEQNWQINRAEIADQTVFVSHETYTPARGGSAAAEVKALRHVFGNNAEKIVVANTKGFTGHAMGAGIEDILAIKSLETGIIPPIANFKEIDPDLGVLNLSRGGVYPVNYALRLGAGFGSQISMSLTRYVSDGTGKRHNPEGLGYEYRIYDQTQWHNWLSQVSGYPDASVEVVYRTLRIKDQGAPKRAISQTNTLSEKTPASLQSTPSIPVVSTNEPAAIVKTVDQAAIVTTPVPVNNIIPVTKVDPVQETVLAVVAAKTGYPKDMLDLELDLEADLGIDTVKQAEVFAAIRENFQIPRIENLKLRDFPTLKRVMQFVYDHRPDLAVNLADTNAASMADNASATVADMAEPASASATINEATNVDEVTIDMLKLVAEKTGYPQDMLDLDLDLEADLGVDTVKQAELFAATREHYHIPRDENRKLRDFPTLRHVIKFVYDHRPDLQPAISTTKSTSDLSGNNRSTAPVEMASNNLLPSTSVEIASDAVKDEVLKLVAEKTGYPQDMLDLDLDLEADLGVDTVKQAELFAATREHYHIARDENRKLRDFPTLGHVIKFVYDHRPDLKPANQNQLSSTASSITETNNLNSDQSLASVDKVEEGKSTNEVESDHVQAEVLKLVAEKTGYPEDMLDLDLDLEADLGVDTVKQAELFAATRALFNIPRDENRKLKDYPTLRHVIQFVYSQRPELKAGAQAASESTSQESETRAESTETDKEKTTTYTIEEANKVPRRVPTPILRPMITGCKPTGIKVGSGSRILIMPDQSGVSDSLAQMLKARGAELLWLNPDDDRDAITAKIHSWLSEGNIQGIFWLPALDHEGDLNSLTKEEWHSAIDIRIRSLYATMRALYAAINSSNTFLISALRLGGQHGYGATGAFAPMGGAVSGFTKTYKRERSEALVKAVDFTEQASADEIAQALLDEVEADAGAVEIGYKDGLRWTIGLTESLITSQSEPLMELNNQSVFVITGAAGSIVSAITTDLANNSKGIFYLLDLTPVPDANNSDLKLFNTDKDQLKREIFDRLKAQGERATPAMVEKELAILERAQAALAAIQSVEYAGGEAHYYSVDLKDADGVKKIIDEIKERHGRIDLLIHAAGLEISRFLSDKEAAEFDLVFDVKVVGWFNLLSAIGNLPLASVVVFSSIAGRFGNGGQTDYSAANDLLCKYISNFRTTRPATRAIAIDWTAWGGIGMATRGSIPKMMAMAGIDMLSPESGVPTTRREVLFAHNPGEVVVAGRLGILLNEWDETGGILPEAIIPQRSQIMLERVTGMKLYQGLTAEVTLDPTKQPFLFDHQIEAIPVLPGVMGIEGFAELATLLLPNWHIRSIENINFLAPFKFYRNEERVVKLQAQFFAEGEEIVAHCALLGVRHLPNQPEAQYTTHFTGQVRLSKLANETGQTALPAIENLKMVSAQDIYQIYFHGPAYQLLKEVGKKEEIIGLMVSPLPDNHQPSTLTTTIAPRLIELCFQTAGVWEIGTSGLMGLPAHIETIFPYQTKEPSADEQFIALVTVNPKTATYDAVVIDKQGQVYLELFGYRTIALPNRVDEEKQQPLNQAMI